MNMVDFVDKVKLFTQDSFKSVEKCWWRNREINCLGMFANEVLDSGVCFTFIPNRGAARNLVHSGTTGLVCFFKMLILSCFRSSRNIILLLWCE